MPIKKRCKTQKKVNINLRKNKIKQIYCNSLDSKNNELVEKLKNKKNESNHGNYKNSNNDTKLVFDTFPNITIDELMKMA